MHSGRRWQPDGEERWREEVQMRLEVEKGVCVVEEEVTYP
jgi:hypothetical protein